MKIKRIGTNGFTLIEIIASIIIIGVLTAFVSIGTASIIEGYILTKKNADTAMRTQVALSRLIKEFSTINEVDKGTNTSITYSYIKDGTPAEDRIVSWSGETNDLLLGGNKLAENVSFFELKYYASHDDPEGDNNWDDSKIIGITLKITGASDVVSPFSIKVTPRNLE